jgi:histidinol-phosphate aminotransferase
MDRVVPPRPDVARLVPYDVPPPTVPVVLATNESPYNLPPPVLARVHELVDALAFNRYPDPTARALREAIGARYGLGADHVIVGNGGDEILLDLLLAWGGPGRSCLSFPPGFAMYGICCDVTGTGYVEIERDTETFAVPIEAAVEMLQGGAARQAVAGSSDERGGEGAPVIVIACSPNNPTGTLTPRADIERLLAATDAVVLVDEAYAEFSGETVTDLIDEHANLIVLRTFSKAFSLAGLRVGYALGRPETLAPLYKVKMPYNEDAFAQAVALACLENAQLFEARWAETRAERERLAEALSAKPGTTVLPSAANYLCARVEGVGDLAGLLLDGGVLVRDVGGGRHLRGYVRVTVGSPAENDAVIAAWPGRGEDE